MGRRNCTKLVEGVRKQIEVVRELVPADTPVHGILCFVADWGLLTSHLGFGDVRAVWPKRMFKWLAADGPLGIDDIAAVHMTLARSLKVV